MKPSGAERIDRLVLDTSGYSHLRVGHARVLTLEHDGHLLTFDTDYRRVASLPCTVLAAA